MGVSKMIGEGEKMKYFGSWNCHSDMARDFAEDRHYDDLTGEYVSGVPEGLAQHDEVLIAAYDSSGYDGYATIIYLRDGKLYECRGSHCSCMGLEGQWGGDEISLEYLEFQLSGGGSYLEQHGSEAVDALRDALNLYAAQYEPDAVTA